MPSSKPLVNAKGEVREIQASDLKSFRPAEEALPASLRRKVDHGYTNELIHTVKGVGYRFGVAQE